MVPLPFIVDGLPYLPIPLPLSGAERRLDGRHLNKYVLGVRPKPKLHRSA